MDKNTEIKFVGQPIFKLNELLSGSNRALKKQTGDPPNQLQLNWQ